jgi:dTDP-4-dehydrorhamnose reductase
MMKILVTGANGQLGNEIRNLADSFPDFHFLFTDVAELNIADENAVEQCVTVEKIDAIINCAAYTAVDKAEQEPEMAFLINSTAVANLARVSARFNILLVHVSTDYVFNGKGYRPYNEEDPRDPISVYAKSKADGEQQISEFARKAIIIRTSWLYSEFGNNFIKTILKYGKERGLLNVVFDQVGTPTYARDLASAILQIIASPHPVNGIEIFHYANEGVASWYDFARAIVDISGIRCKINPIETKDYPLPAVRPCFSVFNKTKIKQRYQLEIPDWRDSLKDCMKRLGYQ